MSRLMREELDRQNRGGPIAQLFNRWFVILPLFVLVVGVLVWTFWPTGPDRLYEQGAALMDSKNPADWERAWRDYLEPLERDHPDHRHKAEVDKFRKQIEQARADAEAALTVGEGQRLYQLGERLRKDGQPAQARLLWVNLIEAFGPWHRRKNGWKKPARRWRRLTSSCKTSSAGHPCARR